MKPKPKPTRPSWADCPPAAIAHLLPFLDGSTVYHPSMFADAGVPPALVERHTQSIYAVSSHNSFNAAPKSVSVTGISSLPVLGCMVRDLGLIAESKKSRNGQAIAFRYVLKKWLDSKKT